MARVLDGRDNLGVLVGAAGHEVLWDVFNDSVAGHEWHADKLLKRLVFEHFVVGLPVPFVTDLLC